MERCLKQRNMTLTNLSQLANKLFFVALASMPFCMEAQVLQEYKAAYPDFNEVILKDKQSYSFSIENKKLKVIQNNYFESMILSEFGIHNNLESFSYSELVKLNGYDAYSVITTNGKERKVKVTQSSEKQSTSRSVFFDDVRKRELTFPNLEAGAKKVYNYQREFLDPFLLHKFMFGSNLPIKNSSLEVIVSKDINIGYKVFNDPNQTIKFEKIDSKGKWIYTWTLTDVKAVKYESNSPGYLHVVPHIDVYIKDYTIANNTTQVLDNVDKLYDYYKAFIVNLNQNEDASLKTIAIDLAAPYSNDADKVKSIFYWVKDNIKYIAFENGYEGFIPREASKVFEQKFGDCKDMASIITAMCEYAEIKNVNIAWIGTREIPYSYDQLSTPAVDNHMIAIFEDGDNVVFLDATDKATRYGLPTSFIQDKEALVKDGNSFKLVKVPVVSSKDNKTQEFVKIKIENDQIIGTGKVSYFGYARSELMHQIGDAANKARHEMIKSLVTKGNNKFNLISFSERNIDDRDKPYEVDYSFNLSSYIIKADKDLYLNLNLDKFLEKQIIEKDRVFPLEFDYLTMYDGSYELELPKNMSVKLLPKNLLLENELLSITSNYTQKDNSIFLKSNLKLNKLRINPEDFALWNESIKKLQTHYNELIILTKN